MFKKKLIRRKYLHKRQKKYYNIDKKFFNPLIKILKKNFLAKKLKIALYYPALFELDVLKILDVEYFQKSTLLLPILEDKKIMNFYKWKENEILHVNNFGILEPEKSKKIFPNLILVPLIAFDNNKSRLGYGQGFYDRYLNKLNKIKKNFLTVGVAFSFQKYHKLPINSDDIKLDLILTEKGIIN